ncbi:MAG: 23S rRNA (guanosine(2251)-2'-O)-methyltransferase RlmB [Pseudomonadota bacterium]
MSETEIIYGVNPVLEVLKAGTRRCHEVFLADKKKTGVVEQIAKIADKRKVSVNKVSREQLGNLSNSNKHQGVAARVDCFKYHNLESLIEVAIDDDQKAFIIILDGITDPQNVGSLIRTAHLLGVHGAIMPRDNACAVTPAVVKASAGATEYLPIVQVTNITNTIKYLKNKGIWVAAAEACAEKSIYDTEFAGYNFALVLGSEGAGVRRLVRETCDFLVYIPMRGQIASYNVSVAGALLMGEVARQRRNCF